MNTDSEKVILKSRLNPFVFPSETTLRFFLLIIAIVSISLAIYSALYLDFLQTQGILRRIMDQVLACKEPLGLFSSAMQKANELNDPRILSDYVEAQERCEALLNHEFHKSTWVALGISGLFLGIAGIICSLISPVMIRWERMMNLETQSDMEEVSIYLKNLCQEVGVIHPPRFLLKPASGSRSGKTFGFLGHYYLVLPTGLIILFDQDRDAFRAIVLHELAHLRNSDIDRTYFSIAAGFVFIFAILVTVFLAWRVGLFDITWRIIALSIFVYLTMTSVIRSREFYADLRASINSNSEILKQLLINTPQLKVSKWKTGLASFLKYFPYFKNHYWYLAFQFHPRPSERCHILENPDRLFYFNFWQAVAVGIASGAAFRTIEILISPALGSLVEESSSTLESYITALILSLLSAGIIGLGVWREAFVSLMYQPRSLKSGRLGVGLGLGLFIGQFLSPYGVAELSIWYQPFAIVWHLIWGILFLILLYYCFEWIAVGASAWLRIAVLSPSPRPFYTLGLIVVSIWLFWLFTVIPLLQTPIEAIIPDSIGAIFINFFSVLITSLNLILQQPLTLLALICIWAFPLSTWFWRNRLRSSASIPDWAFLEKSDHQIYLSTQHQAKYRSFRSVLTLSLKSGLIYFGLLLVICLLLRIGLSESVRATETARLIVVDVIPIGLAALIQAVIAVRVTRSTKYLSTAYGLFSAFITGCATSLSALVINVLFGGTLVAPWIMFSLIVNMGALLALLLILAMSMLKPKFSSRDLTCNGI